MAISNSMKNQNILRQELVERINDIKNPYDLEDEHLEIVAARKGFNKAIWEVLKLLE
jgi:hypothetical protein